MEKRLGEIEIMGKKYPLNFSVRIAQEFGELLADKKTDNFAIMLQNIKILALMLRDGAEYFRVILGTEITPPTEEELELILTPADNERVVQAIQNTLQVGGKRQVQAKAKKKEEPAKG